MILINGDLAGWTPGDQIERQNYVVTRRDPVVCDNIWIGQQNHTSFANLSVCQDRILIVADMLGRATAFYLYSCLEL